jgi:hypothetical protein
MLFRWLADVVLGAHLAFVLFVALGGLLVLRRPRLAWVHVPAAAWGVLIELMGWVCPLTPLENALRLKGGEAAYAGDFIGHYVAAVLYPAGLTRGIQMALAAGALALNAAVYWRVARVHRAGRVPRRGRTGAPPGTPRPPSGGRSR